MFRVLLKQPSDSAASALMCQPLFQVGLEMALQKLPVAQILLDGLASTDYEAIPARSLPWLCANICRQTYTPTSTHSNPSFADDPM